MKDFKEAEKRILALMSVGTEFEFQNKRYRIVLSGKPICQKGEPKTDIYLLAESACDRQEIKISYKKENADFIENKMSAERAEQLLGSGWEEVIKRSTIAISDRFEKRVLIYKNKIGRTGKGSITLGWKFELLNKNSGDLSGKIALTERQVLDVYAGSHLSEEKRNAFVCGREIKNSGMANYILMNEKMKSAQDVIDHMIPMEQYVRLYPDIYFACKALNYRTFEEKWDGDRPLSVQVEWAAENGKLVPKLVYDKPLTVKGNEMAVKLLNCMKTLKVKTTEDLNRDNIGTDRIM